VDSLIKEAPAFSIHKDNFFISGVPLNEEITKSTADAKYQISFKQLMTRNTLPWDTYLFLTYTQKAFWNIYENSSPFQEINFNPSIGFGKPVYNKNNRLVGLASLMLEHESNGRDSIFSRSWNSVNLEYSFMLNPELKLTAEAWLPFSYKSGNPDLLDYIGLAEANLEYDIIPKKFMAELMLRKGLEWNWKGAYRARIFYRPFKMSNQYFMLEWFNGYAESLVNYTEHVNMIRVGYVIKTNELDILKQ
jgi:phospholipase A1